MVKKVMRFEDAVDHPYYTQHNAIAIVDSSYMNEFHIGNLDSALIKQITAGTKCPAVTQDIKKLPLRNMQISFDPNSIIPLENVGNIYKSVRIVDDWGILESKSNGAILITEDWKHVILPFANSIKSNNNVEETESWKLQLKVSNK